MMDNEDAWFYFHDEVREKIDLSHVLKTVEYVCSALGFKLANSWETYVTELPKFPWTSMYLTSLEFEECGEIVQAKELQDRILYAIYYGPNGLKTNDFSGMETRDDQNADEVKNCDPFEVECPENVGRKEEELMDLDFLVVEAKSSYKTPSFAKEKTLASIYLNPSHPASFGGLDAVYRAVKEEGKSKITRKRLQDWLSQQDVYTLHKPARMRYKRSRVIVSGVDAHFQEIFVMFKISVATTKATNTY
ncbi:hypothetical protein ACROYT_G013758 [Oculina patagonica]